MSMDTTTNKNVDLWLKGHYDPETKATIQRLLEENPKEIEDAFYTTMSFGTGGMRGIMGVGSNRMNSYTVGAATQGLANYLNKQPPTPKGHSVFIGYDSRHHSREFAEESAKILAANGIHAYLCKELRPTPYVSFGCRYKHCSAAIMVTASHNPKEYNGYKVYWNDGGQVLPPHDKQIIAEFNAITDVAMIEKVSTLKHPLIEWVGEDVDKAYLKAITDLQSYPNDNKANGGLLKVIYTSLHGTGISLMPQALQRWGFTNVALVDKQITVDGDFPTVTHPNPEEPAALAMGIQRLKEVQGDLLIATDPDADRVAVAVAHKGKVELLNGNQIACLCLEHICEALTHLGKLPERAAFVKSIVTTEMFQAIADHYHRPCFNILPGFKYVAEKIRLWELDPEGYQFVFGAEESYGYLLGTQSRDKDAILSGVLLCEIALQAKLKGKTLIDKLDDLYRKYGVYYEALKGIEFEAGKAGSEQMREVMVKLRSNPPEAIAGVPVIAIEDYAISQTKELASGKTHHLAFPKSDVLLFWLADKTKVVVRPSGTEPKVKLYCGVVDAQEPLDKALQSCQERAERIQADLQRLLSNNSR